MHKVLRFKIKGILIVAMFLLPMQHGFAQISDTLHSKHGDVLSLHHGDTNAANLNADNGNSCDTHTTTSDCKADHAGSCSDNCSVMGHLILDSTGRHDFENSS